MYSPVICVSFVFVLSVFGLSDAIPVQQQQQQHPKDAATAENGFATVVWSVMDECFDEDSAQPTAVCIKSKALTALDRVLSKSTVIITDGVALSARAGKSLPVDQQAEKADRAALDAAKNSDEKNALLDDMLVSRMEQIVSTRSIVMDDVEGRGKKKDKKHMKLAMMMAGMTAVGIMGPMALKIIALIAVKALLISKIALVLSAITILKKLMQSQKSSSSNDHETEIVSEHHEHHDHHRSMRSNAHDMAYTGQKQ